MPRQGKPLEVRCTCSEAEEVTSRITLDQDEPRVWWYAALGTFLFALSGGTSLWGIRGWSVQCRLVASSHEQARGDTRA